jgi:hypothetical protein
MQKSKCKSQNAKSNFAFCILHFAFPLRPSVSSVVKKSASRGFTLLEVILSLSLAVGVMGVIAMAINMHAKATMSGRAQVAQAQLARAVLNQISDDLRCAIQPFEQDFSGAFAAASDAASDSQSAGESDNLSGGENAQGIDGFALAGGQGSNKTQGGAGAGASAKSPSGSTSKSSGSGSAAGGASSGGQSSGGGSTGAASTGSDSSSTTGGSTTTSADLPVLIGTPYELQLDVSRLPRVDQYETMMGASGTLADIPSDVKTVAYYVANVSAARSAAVSEHSSGGATTALVRRSLDRAVTRYASQYGDAAGLDAAAEILATEVTNIQFAYFDGSTWLTEWDSQTQQGLPLAVEIRLAIATRRDGNTAQTAIASLTGDSGDDIIETTFRHVVHLRGADPADGGGGTTSAGDTTGSADSGTTPTTGTQQ